MSGLVRRIDKMTVTIPNGQAVSNSFKVGEMVSLSIATPAAWTAGVLAFETSTDDGLTWRPVIDDAGTEVSIATGVVGTADRVIVNATILEKLAGLNLMRLASGPAGARVNQGADRVFTIIAKS